MNHTDPKKIALADPADLDEHQVQFPGLRGIDRLVLGQLHASA